MSEENNDKQRVIDYLNILVAGKLFQISDLEALTASDLKYDTPIQDLDIQLLEDVLETFRKQYKSKIFKET